MSRKKIRISNLKYLAMKNLDSLRTDEEIRKDPVTDLFYQEIDDKISYGELVNIQNIGSVAGGKSTLAIEEAHIIFDCLRKYKKTVSPLSIENICPDQLDYLRKMKNKDLGNTVLMIDEWNKLGETGFNATTEDATLQYYSDVQAQRYIHRVSCSPKEVIDPNSDMIVDVLSVDKEAKITNALLSYRIVTANRGEVVQLVGHIVIPVRRALECNFYSKYRKRKFEKMEFLTEHGVKDIREIEYAKIILNVYQELAPLARFIPVKKDIIRGYVDKKRREEREIFSILTSEDVVSKADGLLSLDRTISQLEAREKTLVEKGMEKEAKDLFYETSRVHGVLLSLIRDYEKLVRIGEMYNDI